MNLTNIEAKLIGGKWAIQRQAYQSLHRNLYQLDQLTYGGIKAFILGNPLKMKALEASNLNNSEASLNEGTGEIAIINISGILTKGVDEEDENLLGLVNLDRISLMLDELANDPTVTAIVLNFNCPGGETVGIAELGRKIKNIDSNIKPVFAWTETQCASAAYWLASQARVIGMTSSAEVGSIGVYILVNDESLKMANEGTKVNAISSGKFKLMGHPFRSLNSEEQAILQADVESQHNEFKTNIKNSRPGVKDEALEGLSYEGPKAFELGLVDVVVDSLNEFIQELGEQTTD